MKKSSAPVPRVWKWFPGFIGILLLASLVLAAGAALGFHSPSIWLLHVNNGELLASNYHLDEDDFNDPRLLRLRRREKLLDVVSAGRTPLEKVVLLRHWVHQQWQTQSPFYYPPWDALEILDLARSGKSRGFCAQYAIVFLQACQSLGIHARYTELPGHFAASVWSDDLNHWVLMDPTFDVYFEKDGVPTSSHWLSEAYWHHGEGHITRVSFDGTRSPVTHDDLALYRLYAVVKLANQLKHPAAVNVNGVRRQLVHSEDYRTYPMVGRDQLTIVSSFLAWKDPHVAESLEDKPVSSDRDDFRYRMNQTIISIARRLPESAEVKLILTAENAPTFEHFEITANGKPWQAINGRGIAWILMPGMNHLMARVETQGGWEGPPSDIAIYYKPPNAFSL